MIDGKFVPGRRATPRRVGFRLVAVVLALMGSVASAAVASAVSIADAKNLADGASVELAGKLVTAVFPGFFYVSEVDHTRGLRVVSDGAPMVGSTADLSGVMATSDQYERQIAVTSAVFHDYEPAPISNKQVGGANLSYNTQTGAGQRGVPAAEGLPNNIGELVKTSGMVTMGEVGDAADFPIDDGSHSALLIVVPPGVVNPGYGARVTVTGISSIRYVAGVTRRAILLRGPQDIRVDQPAPEFRYGDEMVYVAAGVCDIGISTSDPSLQHCVPRHQVYMDGYWIGKYEVTRAEYRKFIEAGGYSDSQYWSDEGWWWKQQFRTNAPAFWTDSYWYQGEDYAVVGVSPYEMDAYCKWAGGRRTTEAEWEKAASWDPIARHARKYPWGDEWDPEKCNNSDDSTWSFWLKVGPVGMYPDGVSYYGCHDMSGNVFEWCLGFYVRDYYSHPPAIGWIDPQGADRPEYDYYNTEAYRGGSWYPGEPNQRCAGRFGQIHSLYNADIGFRVVR